MGITIPKIVQVVCIGTEQSIHKRQLVLFFSYLLFFSISFIASLPFDCYLPFKQMSLVT